MPDDPQVIEELTEEVIQKEDRREGKRKRENDNIPRSGIDLKPQPEEFHTPLPPTPVEEEKEF